jgi:ribonucleoside-diphosphate reductase alpha chain
VLSLPDAVSRALQLHYFNEEEPHQLGLPMNGGTNGHSTPKAEVVEAVHQPVSGFSSGADMCPECGTVTLIRTEGCRKCLTCGYSEC